MKASRGKFQRALAALGMGILLLGACAPAAPVPTPKPAPAPTVAPAAPAPTPTSTPRPAVTAPTPMAPARPTEEKPRYGGVLKVGVHTDLPMYDPHSHAASSVAHTVSGVFNQIVSYDPTSYLEPKIVPDLAERWELSPDGSVYTFHLAKGVKFQDGAPLTAHDVVFSLNKIRKPPKGILPSRADAGLVAVNKVEAADDYTVKVTLKYPSATFLTNLAYVQMVVVPKDYMEKGGYWEGKNILNKKPIGSGPFIFKEHMRGVSAEVVKNPNYFKKGLPYLDGQIIYIIPDAAARLAALRTEQIHTIVQFAGVRLSEEKMLKQALGDRIVTWHNYPDASRFLFTLNHTRKPFDDLRVRQAIRLALNNEEAFQIVYEGVGQVTGPVARTYWALPQEELQKYPGFEPDYQARLAKAKALLAEAGYPKGFDMEIIGVTGRGYAISGMQYAAAALKRIGINVKVVPQEVAAYYENLSGGNYDSATDVMSAFSGDPEGIFGSLYVSGSARNYPHYSNPKIDELYEKQARELDPAKRREIVWEMQRIVLQDVAWPMYGVQGNVAVQLAAVRGGRVAAPFESYFNFRSEAFWLAQ